MLFVDFEAKYSVNQGNLVEILTDFKIPHTLNRLVTMTLRKVKIYVETWGKIEVIIRVRQGDPLAGTLFNLILERKIWDSEINRNAKLYYKSHQNLS